MKSNVEIKRDAEMIIKTKLTKINVKNCKYETGK